MKLTKEEYTTIGQAIAIMTYPNTRWSRDMRKEVSEKLIEIMGKYMPEEN